MHSAKQNLQRLFVLGPFVASLCLPAVGCGLFRRNKVSTNVSSSVEINEKGRDLATLTRGEYEIIETSIGQDRQVGVFIFTLPVGQHTTKEEGAASAYYAAVDRIPECDILMSPRVSVKRKLIPLVLVNIVVRTTLVKGRCAHFIGERDGVVNERGYVPAAEPQAEPESPAQEPKPSEDSQPDPT